jgi:hypothetical protein
MTLAAKMRHQGPPLPQEDLEIAEDLQTETCGLRRKLSRHFQTCLAEERVCK